MFLGRFRNFQHFLVSATGATPATLAIIITAIDIQFQIFPPPQIFGPLQIFGPYQIFGPIKFLTPLKYLAPIKY